MKNTFVLQLAFLMLSGSIALAGTHSTDTKFKILPNVSWERIYNEQDFKNDFAKISPKSLKLILAGGYLQAKAGIWIWKIDDDGKKIAEVTLNEVKINNRTAKPYRIIDIVINYDESIWVIAEAEPSQIVLVKTNFNGELLSSQRITGGMIISKAVPLSDGSLLMIGHVHGKATYIKLDATGKEEWTKTSSQNDYSSFVNGFPSKDGGFVLFENSGASSNYALDGKAIIINKYTANGIKISDSSITTNLGLEISAVAFDDTFTILYGKDDTSDQRQYFVEQYDMKLNSKWKLNVVTPKYALAPLNISSVNNGSYIVASQLIGSFEQFIAYLDASGAKKWDYTSKMLADKPKNLVCTGSTCFLIETIFNENNTEQIKVTKFRPE